MKKQKYLCRNCRAEMESEDYRFECPKCGFRYIIAGGVVIEPERQRPDGAAKISIMPASEIKAGKKGSR